MTAEKFERSAGIGEQGWIRYPACNAWEAKDVKRYNRVHADAARLSRGKAVAFDTKCDTGQGWKIEFSLNSRYEQSSILEKSETTRSIIYDGNLHRTRER